MLYPSSYNSKNLIRLTGKMILAYLILLGSFIEMYGADPGKKKTDAAARIVFSGTISPASQTIVGGDEAVQLTGTAVSGCSNGNYQWESSTDGVNFTPIGGALGKDFIPSHIFSTTWYRRKACTGTYSNVAVVNVSVPLSGGSVTPSTLTIPVNSSPGLLGNVAASGGSCSGSYSYQWQVSTNGTTFTNLSGANARDYTPGNLSVNTYYRRMVTCGGLTAYSNVITITVTNTLFPGNITSGNQSIGYLGVPATIAASVASGGTCSGAYVYQWEFSTNGTDYEETDSANIQNLSFTEGLITTTYYRRRVACNGDTVYTAPVTVTVAPPMNPGQITTANQTINFGAVPAAISATAPSNGTCGGSYSYQWQISYDGTSFSDIAGATSPGLTYTTNLDQRTFFRRRVTCGIEVRYTSLHRVNIIPPTTVGGATGLDPTTDSLYKATAEEIKVLSNMAPDSLVIKNTVDSIARLEQDGYDNYATMLNNNSLGVTMADTSFYQSFPVVSRVADKIDNSKLDSIAVFHPDIFDADIQLLITNNQLGKLDSLFQLQPKASIEELVPWFNANASGTTLGGISGSSGNITANGANTLNASSPASPIAGAVISGKSLVLFEEVATYTANFKVPVTGSSQIKWLITGGYMIAQNTNPANGPISIEIHWTVPYFDPAVPFTCMVALYDGATGQYAVLPVSVVKNYTGMNRIFPLAQTIFYGQQPGLITAVPANPMFTQTYQWQSMDMYGDKQWQNITGATAANYRPTIFDKPWMLYRRLGNIIVPGFPPVVVPMSPSPASSVKVNGVTGGFISLSSAELKEQLSIPYNTKPTAVSLIPAMGGMTVAGSSYTYTWQYSIQVGVWVNFGVGEAFPATGMPNVTIQGTKIRRVAKLTGLPASVLALPSEYWEGISNVLTVNTHYQTVDYENRNYIRENTILVAGIQTWEDADLLAVEKKITSTVYFDGLERAVQTVAKGTHYDEGNGQWYDMVNSLTYEAGGHLTKAMLPYATTQNFGKFKTDAATAQPQFYQSKYGEAHAYARIETDNSPEDRIIKTYGVGTSWGGTNLSTREDISAYAQNENVQRWSIGYNATDFPVSRGAYKDFALHKTEFFDEQNKKIITYTNKEGLIVLKKAQVAEGAALTVHHGGWNCTYFVYDDFGQLRVTIPAKAVDALMTNNWAFSNDIFNGLCYINLFDERGRLAANKKPDAGWVYKVYDVKDRPVFEQTANQRAKTQPEWTAILYDALNRPVIGGTITYTGDQLALQAVVTTQTTKPSNPAPTIPPTLELSTLTSGIRQATQSVTMVQGFESGADFTAQLYSGPGSVDNESTIIESVLVNKNPIPSGSILQPISFTYYDDYSFAGAKQFVELSSMPFSYTGAELSQAANIRKSDRTLGLPTGKKAKILDEAGTMTGWLASTIFYDEEGRTIESIEDNVKGGADITGIQRFFDGRVLSIYQSHSASGTVYDKFPLTVKFKYDRIGRLIGKGLKLNNSSRSWSSSPFLDNIQEDADASYKMLFAHKYDELGRRVQKTLAPQYNNGQGLETLNFDFNIKGWLTGINKDYALGEYNSDQWEHYFGIYIGYDNRDNKFSNGLLNGNITGVQWKSQGDNTPRKYEYEYDNLDRLTKATFTQKGNSSEGWNNSRLDYTVKDIAYDANGNLLSMTNMGTLLGSASKVEIDKLSYVYKPLSNRLTRIDDLSTTGASNGKSGDFKDGTNTGGTDDYDYDLNGNLSLDRNKEIRTGSAKGVTYNIFDKPVTINVEGKGHIRYVYDGGGKRIAKIVTDNSAVAQGGQTKITETYYAGAFVYESNELQYINHEEGRIRIITPYINAVDPANVISGGVPMPGGKEGVFDYQIVDHLGSVRSTITEEINKAASLCTMEASAAQYEEPIFGQTGANNEVAATRSPRPANWPASGGTANESVSKLFTLTTTPKIGPNALLKVMAGDKISARTEYFYVANPGATSQSPNGVSALAQSLAGALATGKVGELAKTASAAISGNLGTDLPLQDFFVNQASGSGNTTPKAYLNYMFFDEQFNFVSESSGFLRVANSPGVGNNLVLGSARAPKNGYVYIYLSNESSEPVYFDNFAVSHERSRLIQEDHYYAFGLRIAGISSKAVGTLKNKHQFQGIYSEFSDELGLDWNEFDLRNYDAQIGRWTGQDPYDEFGSPYTGMGNNPATFSDPTGGFIEPALAQVACPGATVGFFNTTLSFIGIATSASVSSANAAISGQASYAVSVKVSMFSSNPTSTGPSTTKNPTYRRVSIPLKEYNQGRSHGGRTFQPVRKWRINYKGVGRLASYILRNPITTLIAGVLTPSNAFDDFGAHPENQWLAEKAMERVEEQFEEEARKNRRKLIRYVTYTKIKLNPDGTEFRDDEGNLVVYSGRASADISKVRLTDEQIVAKRDASHHMKNFSDAELDKASYDRYAIRGREQQLIDYNGGAQSDLDSPRKSGNQIRGVSRWNKKGMMYWLASTREFKLLFKFTGYFQ